MIKKEAEPWQRDAVQDFLRLLEGNIESERAALYSLSGYTPLSEAFSTTSKEERTKKRIENAWPTIRAHSIYRWLEEQPAFCKSWKLFNRIKGKAKPDAKIAAPDSAIILLQIIVDWASILHHVKHWMPKQKK